MAAPFENPQHVQGAPPTDGGKQDDVLGNDFTVENQKPNIGTDHPQKNPNESLEITRSTHPELNNPPHFPVETRVKSDEKEDENVAGGGRSGENTPIVMGCMHCLLYVMTLKFDPECPQCKNTDLIDVLGGDN